MTFSPMTADEAYEKTRQYEEAMAQVPDAKYLVVDRLEATRLAMWARCAYGGGGIAYGGVTTEGVPIGALGLRVVVVPGETGQFTVVGPTTASPWSRGQEPGEAISVHVWHEIVHRATAERVERQWPFTPQHYRGAGETVTPAFAIRHIVGVHVMKEVGRLVSEFDTADHTGSTVVHTAFVRRVARNLLVCAYRLYRLIGGERCGTLIVQDLEEWASER